MATKQRKATPVVGAAFPASSETSSSITEEGYSATAAWQANLARCARRAATEPSFYEVAGGTVQRLADEIRAGESK